MKSKEELDALKSELQTISKKLAELSPEELELVTGGVVASGGIHVWHMGVKPDVSVKGFDPTDEQIVVE